MSNSAEKKEKKKKGGGKLLCFFLGFLFGILTIVGSVAGTVVYVINQPVKKTVALIDKSTSADLQSLLFGTSNQPGLLNQKYQEAKITELLGDIGSTVNSLSGENASLSTLNNLSPKISTVADTIAKTLGGYGIPVDSQTLLYTPFKGDNGLSAYLKSSMQNAAAGDLLQAFSGNSMSPLLRSLCYGEENVDYVMDESGNVTMLNGAKKRTLKDFTGENLSAIFNQIPVCSVLEINPDDSLLRAIAYGSANRYKVENGQIVMNQMVYSVQTEYGETSFFNDKGEQVLCEYETLAENAYKLTFADGKTQYVKENEVYADQAFTTPLLYQPIKIGDMTQDSTNLVDNILLKDALGVTASSHGILLNLAYGPNYTVNDDTIISEEERTVGDFRTNGGKLIDQIELDDVISMQENYDSSLILHLLYGKEGTYYKKIDTDGDGVNDGITQNMNFYVGKNDSTIIFNDGDTPVRNVTIDQENKLLRDENGKEYPYSRTGSKTVNGISCYKITVTFSPTSLGDLSSDANVLTNLTKSLTMKDLFDEETIAANKFLPHLQNECIDDLPTAIMNLTVTEVYHDEIYEEDGKTLKSYWKYLLVNEDGKVDDSVTITQMDKMLDNMQQNVHLATLNELTEDGLVEFSGKTLSSDIKTSIVIPGSTHQITINGTPISEAFVREDGSPKNTIGELTIAEVVSYLDGILEILNIIGA